VALLGRGGGGLEIASGDTIQGVTRNTVMEVKIFLWLNLQEHWTNDPASGEVEIVQMVRVVVILKKVTKRATPLVSAPGDTNLSDATEGEGASSCSASQLSPFLVLSIFISM